MAGYGLTPTGFVAKTVEVINQEIADQQRGDIDPALDTSAESLIGNLNAIVATKVREVWELAALVHAARDPRRATLAGLDAVCAITGTTREPATKGVAALEVRLAAGVTLPAGHIAQVEGQATNRWVTLADAANPGGAAAWIPVSAEAETAGRYVANANTISVIATPFAGWLEVRNPTDAAEGRDAEQDPELRLRREEELSREGTATVPAMQTDLLALRDAAGAAVLVAAHVDENTSSYPDALGRPPKSIEAVIQFPAGLSGGALATARKAVAEQLWKSKPAGLELVGDEHEDIVDSNGQTRRIRWNHPSEIDVWAAVTLAIDPAAYAGEAAVKAAILAFGDALKMGNDVVRMKLGRDLLALGGVGDVPVIDLGDSATTRRAANVTVGPRAVAVFDSSRITVTTTVASL